MSIRDLLTRANRLGATSPLPRRAQSEDEIADPAGSEGPVNEADPFGVFVARAESLLDLPPTAHALAREHIMTLICIREIVLRSDSVQTHEDLFAPAARELEARLERLPGDSFWRRFAAEVRSAPDVPVEPGGDSR